LAGRTLRTRFAHYLALSDGAELIDRGIVVYFAAPNSFTGEDCVEYQVHGGATVVDWLLEVICRLGARPAEPGEFSLRAFLNDKLDLTQAEAIADLIASSSRSAAKAALESLGGRFAAHVAEIQAALTALRVMVEAWIDFPDEDLSPDESQAIQLRAAAIAGQLLHLQQQAGEGLALTDGFRLVIAGRPNAGKSSLFNALAGHDAAIVTELPGTTRDMLSRRVRLGGFELEVSDTAGIRQTDDRIEREGVKRTSAALEAADHVLWVADIQDGLEPATADAQSLLRDTEFTVVLNKSDLLDGALTQVSTPEIEVLSVSALTGAGLQPLVAHIQSRAGAVEDRVGSFSARRRHLAALARAAAAVRRARAELAGAPEVAAEELREAQQALSELTGEVTSDDLLGEIFSTFCIGK
jgi:tRNA modification GTPase